MYLFFNVFALFFLKSHLGEAEGGCASPLVFFITTNLAYLFGNSYRNFTRNSRSKTYDISQGLNPIHQTKSAKKRRNSPFLIKRIVKKRG